MGRAAETTATGGAADAGKTFVGATLGISTGLGDATGAGGTGPATIAFRVVAVVAIGTGEGANGTVAVAPGMAGFTGLAPNKMGARGVETVTVGVGLG